MILTAFMVGRILRYTLIVGVVYMVGRKMPRNVWLASTAVTLFLF